jgi:ABC-type dipeptide/oligopeptide/nickel transport system permease subunit
VGLLGFISLGARRPRPAWGDRLGSGLQYFGQSCWVMVVPTLVGTICAHGIAPLGAGIPGFARSKQARSKQDGRR